jgi:hypothetical protein
LCGMLPTPPLGITKSLSIKSEVNLTKGGLQTSNCFGPMFEGGQIWVFNLDWATTFYSFHRWIAWASLKIQPFKIEWSWHLGSTSQVEGIHISYLLWRGYGLSTNVYWVTTLRDMIGCMCQLCKQT